MKKLVSAIMTALLLTNMVTPSFAQTAFTKAFTETAAAKANRARLMEAAKEYNTFAAVTAPPIAAKAEEIASVIQLFENKINEAELALKLAEAAVSNAAPGEDISARVQLRDLKAHEAEVLKAGSSLYIGDSQTLEDLIIVGMLLSALTAVSSATVGAVSTILERVLMNAERWGASDKAGRIALRAAKVLGVSTAVFILLATIFTFASCSGSSDMNMYASAEDIKKIVLENPSIFGNGDNPKTGIAPHQLDSLFTAYPEMETYFENYVDTLKLMNKYKGRVDIKDAMLQYAALNPTEGDKKLDKYFALTAAALKEYDRAAPARIEERKKYVKENIAAALGDAAKATKEREEMAELSFESALQNIAAVKQMPDGQKEEFVKKQKAERIFQDFMQRNYPRYQAI